MPQWAKPSNACCAELAEAAEDASACEAAAAAAPSASSSVGSRVSLKSEARRRGAEAASVVRAEGGGAAVRVGGLGEDMEGSEGCACSAACCLSVCACCRRR